MARDKITEYSSTASENTVVGDVNIAENSALPSDMNNAVREVLSHQKEAFGSGTPLYVDQTNNRVGVNATSPARQFTVQNTIANSGGELGILSSDSSTTGAFGTIHFGNNTDTSLASIRAKADGSTTSGKLEFNTEPNGGAIETRMTITSAGLIGINQGTPLQPLHLTDADFAFARFQTTAVSRTGMDVGQHQDGSGHINMRDPDDVKISTNDTERIRVHSEGNVAIGQVDNQATLCIFGHQQAYTGLQIKNGTNNGSTVFAVFVRSNGTATGSIQQSSDGATTIYNTTSDYRLKESISYEFDATTRLKQLKPCRFVFKESLTGQTIDGFLAHEVSSIVPEAVSGTKDEIDLDGNAKYQGIDHSKLVPLLVKTIQELEARITALESA